ncbi:MAG TPA: amino acid ABC transporter permease [Marmoricola sp.]|nr:amino acid ABC transporter permease [Marmoricola sp.]
MTWLTDNWGEILVAFGVTVEMTVMAGIIAMVVGFVLAALRVSPIPLGRAVGAAYVRLVRNTPLLLIMLIFAFGLPELDIRPEFHVAGWFGSSSHSSLLNFDVFYVFATAALGLYTAAFVCEAVRSGINAIPVGQAEAARSIGMTFTQTLSNVVLPQAFRAVIPPLASTMIAMCKNSSIASGVGVTEATFEMHKLTNDYSSATFPIFIGFAIGYIVLVALISGASGGLERRLGVLR